MSTQTYTHNKKFVLENGQSLPELNITYTSYGKLNADKSNVIWVCHALTANSDVFDWWNGLFGENDLFNPEEHFIVCANNLGSCYGTTGPLSVNPNTKQEYFSYFPSITTRDMANALNVLRLHLGIEKINTLIGGSQGGQIALEWSLQQEAISNNLILLATNSKHSPWGIAFNESQRLAIKADRTYFANTIDGGKKGLLAARSIALLSYRNYTTYGETQKREGEEDFNYRAASYQRYQGEKLVNRFNAYSYVRLSEAMDSQKIDRDRDASEEKLLKKITAKTLVISIDSDILFPVHEQEFIAKHIPNAKHEIVNSVYGHDGFLIETEKISKTIQQTFNIKQKQIINE